MAISTKEVQTFSVGTLNLEIYPTAEAAGDAAAAAVADFLQNMKASASPIGVIFATGSSQLRMLRTLTSIPDLPWNRICGFHLDEYIAIDENHRASFRRYLRENLTERVPMEKFFAIDGNAPDPESVCRDYAGELRRIGPQLCLLGVGENGHLAFNDPGEANFHDPADVKIVELDPVSRQQQVEEGWFETIQDVPKGAITVTIPAVFRVPKLVVMIPGRRKAKILQRLLTEPISPACPATILRTHPNATAYLDTTASAEFDTNFLSRRA